LNVKQLKTQAFRSLQEDEDDPQFWETDEILEYAYEGFREILKRTEINLTERAIPLYAQVSSFDEETGDPIFESFEGYYSPPIAQVQKVVSIFWKGEKTDDSEPNIHQLEVKTLEQMDLIDPTWRTYKGNGIPQYAVQFAGDFNGFNMQENPFRNRLKYKLYPTPPLLDPELQTALYLMQGDESIDNYSASSDGYGGLASNSGPGIAWGLDTDGDGEIDNGVVPGSTANGIMIAIQNGTFDISAYGNYPVIRYQPDIEPDILYRLTEGVLEYSQLDAMLPIDLQFAIREYMVYRCFDKEGEAQDLRKADRYKTKYDDFIYEYQVQNNLLDTERLNCDSNWSFGMVTNRPVGTGIGNTYNTLRI
jgi:hypothetical protein